jgi:hypothetical protein
MEQPHVLGVLVVSPIKLQNQSSLFWEIAIQQSRSGLDYGGSAGTKEVAVVGEPGDDAYAYAAIRSEFAAFGGHELIDRSYPYDFRSSEGVRGKYYVILDRPKLIPAASVAAPVVPVPVAGAPVPAPLPPPSPQSQQERKHGWFRRR